MKKLKNKKGNLPIIILVLGVLAVCGLALISFYSSSLKTSNNFSGVSLIEELNSQIEYNIYQGKPVDGLQKTKEIRVFNLKNIFQEGFSKKKTIFSVTYNP